MKTFDAMVKEIKEYVEMAPDGKRLWDLITCLRGPDSPSERGGKLDAAYEARRKRKADTVEVIRGKSGLHGGSARFRTDRDYVIVPPAKDRDHFDQHVIKAAAVLGLEVRVKETDAAPVAKFSQEGLIPIEVVVKEKGKKVTKSTLVSVLPTGSSGAAPHPPKPATPPKEGCKWIYDDWTNKWVQLTDYSSLYWLKKLADMGSTAWIKEEYEKALQESASLGVDYSNAAQGASTNG